MDKILIQRGKVIRVPADVKLKNDKQTAYIVAHKRKVWNVEHTLHIPDKWFIMHADLEWMINHDIDNYRFFRHKGLGAINCISELLDTEEDIIQEVFKDAKFILQLDIVSEKFNYFYIVEELSEDWSLLDIIGCFLNAKKVQDTFRRKQEALDFGKVLRPLVFELNDYSLPIIKISLSDATYIAKNPDAIYYSVSDDYIASKINKVLTWLMMEEMEYTEEEKVKLVHPTKSIRELFSLENPDLDLADKLDKALMIKWLGMRDDEYDYFYLVEGKSSPRVLDVIGHLNDLSIIQSQSFSELRTCGYGKCPFINLDDSDKVFKLYDLNDVQTIEKKRNSIADLGKISTQSTDEDIFKALEIFKSREVADFCREVLDIKDNDNIRSAIKARIVNCLSPNFTTNELKIDIKIESMGKMEIKINQKPLTYPVREGKKINNKMNHTPYVLLVMMLYRLYKDKKDNKGNKAGVIFQFANSKQNQKQTVSPYNQQVKYNDVLNNKKNSKDLYYNKATAILYGLLYHVLKVTNFDKQDRNEQQWIDAMVKYLGTIRVTENPDSSKMTEYGQYNGTIGNILKNMGKIVEKAREKEDGQDSQEDVDVLCNDFIKLVSNLKNNAYLSSSFAALEWNLTQSGLQTHAMLIGNAAMPAFKMEEPISPIIPSEDPSKKVTWWSAIRDTFFELFKYLEEYTTPKTQENVMDK